MLLEGESAHDRLPPAFAAARSALAWPQVIEPLIRLVREPRVSERTPSARRLGLRWRAAHAEHALRSRGLVGAAQRATERAFRRGPALP